MSTRGRAAPGSPAARAERALRDRAIGLPGVTEDFPWGHRALKVARKAFVFMGADADGLFVTTKLPHSGLRALDRPYAEPTGYGLGRSGWVTARFAPRDEIPEDELWAWMQESYRAIAPKRVVAALDGGAPVAPEKKSKRKTGKKAIAKPRAARQPARKKKP